MVDIFLYRTLCVTQNIVKQPNQGITIKAVDTHSTIHNAKHYQRKAKPATKIYIVEILSDVGDLSLRSVLVWNSGAKCMQPHHMCVVEWWCIFLFDGFSIACKLCMQIRYINVLFIDFRLIWCAREDSLWHLHFPKSENNKRRRLEESTIVDANDIADRFIIIWACHCARAPLVCACNQRKSYFIAIAVSIRSMSGWINIYAVLSCVNIWAKCLDAVVRNWDVRTRFLCCAVLSKIKLENCQTNDVGQGVCCLFLLLWFCWCCLIRCQWIDSLSRIGD